MVNPEILMIHTRSSSTIFVQVPCTRLILAIYKTLYFFKSHAVFRFLDLSSYGLKTINRCQKDDNLGRVFWSTTFTVLISVCILP